MEAKPGRVNPGETELWNCENAFEFVCPRKWESLGQTESPDIRYCGVCSQNVYFCETPEEFVSRGNPGRCVAIRKEVTPNEAFSKYVMGRYTADSVRNRQKNYEREKVWWKDVLALNPTFDVEEIDEIRGKFEPRR